MIEQTEAYYQSLIDSLEAYKSRWEELSELKEQAEFQRQLKELGLSSVDILNMSEEAFQAFKTQYVDALDRYLQATGDGLDAVADTDLTSTADSISKVADATTKIDDEKVSNLSSAMEGLSDTSNLDALYKAFDELKNVIGEISDTLNGVDKEGGLVSALDALTKVSLGTTDEETTGLIGQFKQLEEAIIAVSTAISGGAEGQNLPQGGAPTKQGSIAPSGSPDSGDTGGLTQALETVKKTGTETTNTLIGDEETGFIGVDTKVKDTSTDIGTQDDEGNETLNGSINELGKTTEDVMPDVVKRFAELAAQISFASLSLALLAQNLENLNGANVTVSTSGGGEVNGNANVNGNALAHGLWGAKHSGDTLVGELGQEIVVDANTGTWRTVGDNGAEFTDINRGDIVFNHKQTEAILKHGKVAGRGKALANGTDISTIKIPSNLRPLQEGDKMFDLIKKLSENNDLIQNGVIPPVNSIQKNSEIMARNISNVNNNNQRSIQVNMGDIICKGVTAQEVAGEIGSALKRELGGMYQSATQIAHTTR